MAEEERAGIIVDGILIPGFKTEEEAREAIAKNPELQKKKAIATQIWDKKKNRLTGECPKAF
ncbi:MAG: hypothetical protein ABIG60_03375 [Patescibacteria group bacterium]